MPKIMPLASILASNLASNSVVAACIVRGQGDIDAPINIEPFRMMNSFSAQRDLGHPAPGGESF